MTSQRAAIRELWRRHKDDWSKIVREYADAERRGEVRRSSNRYFVEPEHYARKLLTEGLHKGWLH